MSESHGTTVPADTASSGGNSSLETAKREAGDLKDTAVDEAGHVAQTAKDEAKAVAREVRYQAKDLFGQAQREFKDQAQVQQQRVASGLRAMSDELESMTANAQNPGMATDLLRQVSGRMSSAATWLSDRDPGSLLHEVKSFARRKPGTFIVGAAILGVVAGRLTRALSANASDSSSDAAGSATAVTAGPAYADAGVPATTGQLYAAPPAVEETPVYARSAARGTDVPGAEVGDVRSDSL